MIAGILWRLQVFKDRKAKQSHSICYCLSSQKFAVAASEWEKEAKMLTWEELEAEYSEMYQRIETNDEGDVTMKKVVEHIKGVEAGSGENVWVK